jgi:hypothetical protein
LFSSNTGIIDKNDLKCKSPETNQKFNCNLAASNDNGIFLYYYEVWKNQPEGQT